MTQISFYFDHASIPIPVIIALCSVEFVFSGLYDVIIVMAT